MRIVISGGGTGGHIYPALALLSEMKKEIHPLEVLYIGSETGLERELVQKAGYPFFSIEISGFKRKLDIENFKTVLRFIKGVRRVKRKLKEFQPDVVIGTGGYVSGPVLYAAARLKIPTVIHEQNVVPGLTNRFLSNFADLVAVSFKESIPKFPKAKKVVLTGNPRATEVIAAAKNKGVSPMEFPLDKPLVLLIGGSRGAWPISKAFAEAIPSLSAMDSFVFVYVTGQRDYERMLEHIPSNLPDHIRIKPYLYNAPEVLAHTTLFVGRAGATTLSEITALGIPSVLIPSPYVTENHQEKNARALEGIQAARVILEKDLSGERLIQELREILFNPPLLEKMAVAAKSKAHPDAAKVLIEEIRGLVKTTK